MGKPLRFEVGRPGIDPTMPHVVLSIDGEDFQLAYDFAAIALVEKASGINLLVSAVEEPTFTGVIALFWAASLKAHPKMTMERASQLVDLQNVLGVLHAVRVAWGASRPDAEAAAEGEAEAQANL